jgi:hypothetical protein
VAVPRERSGVTEATSEFAASVSASVESSPEGKVSEYMWSGAIESPAVPLAAAMSACCCSSETSLLKVTMYGTEPGTPVEFDEESVEAVAVEGADVVSAADESAAGVSVLVVPSTASV